MGITHCICVLVPGKPAPPKSWLTDDELECVSVVINITDDEDLSRDSWNTLYPELAKIIKILSNIEEVMNVSI